MDSGSGAATPVEGAALFAQGQSSGGSEPRPGLWGPREGVRHGPGTALEREEPPVQGAAAGAAGCVWRGG